MSEILPDPYLLNPVMVTSAAFLMPETVKISLLLIDDQRIIYEALKKMLDDQKDIVLHYCQDASLAIKTAETVQPTVILQDLLMPNVDGLTLVRYFRVHPKTKNIPLIVLSTKEDPLIKAEAFKLGANDYLVKLPDKIELIARIRYHSLAYTRLLERDQAYQKLEESQQILKSELAEAAQYVRSLLPAPIYENNKILADWKFIPSTTLGGDAFGYFWLDGTHFVIYLLDVCGHGVGAALLSITVMNTLRSQTLPQVDFYQPANVLYALNEKFQMEKHNNMFFTIWYGVYSTQDRKLTYSVGGHPPAILFQEKGKGDFEIINLHTPGLVIGGMPDVTFETSSKEIKSGSRLYLFSDGVYEIAKSDKDVMSLAEFVEVLKSSEERFIAVKKIKGEKSRALEAVLDAMQRLNGPKSFADDFSIVEFYFE